MQDRLKAGWGWLSAAPSRIVSLDLGQRNCAMALVERSPRKLTAWRLFDIPLESCDPHHIAKRATAFYEDCLREYLSPASTVLVVERQRHRSNGSPMVIESVLKTVLLEMSLAVLAGSRCIGILPVAVSKYWGLPEGRADKKRAAVKLVNDRFRSSICKDVLDVFERQPKKDDLADAFLQAWAFADWLDNSAQLNRK